MKGPSNVPSRQENKLEKLEDILRIVIGIPLGILVWVSLLALILYAFWGTLTLAKTLFEVL